MAIELSVGDKGAAAAQSGGGPHRARPRARRIGWGDFRATAAALTAFAAIGIAIALCQTALATCPVEGMVQGARGALVRGQYGIAVC